MLPTKRTIYIGLALLVFSLVLVASSAICLAAPTFNTPVNSDSGHVANAISLSGKAFAGGAPAVVITSVDSYADSLAAGVLANAYSGSLLLTSASALSSDVASELTRLNPAKVFLVGLPSTFVSSVKAAVPNLTDAASIVVLKGADRYETAALVARAVKAKLGTVSKVIVAPGDSYGAALAASALAGAQGWPLLLTPAAGPFPQSAKDAIADLGVSSGIVVGTNVTLGVDGFTVNKRIIGATSTSDPDGRYDACATLADYAVAQGWVSYAHLGLVSGEDYPDGETTAVFVARDKGVLLFAKSTGLPAATGAAIRDHATEVKKVDFVGIGWPVFRELKSLNSARVTGLSATSGPVGGGNKLVLTGKTLTGATRIRVGKVDVPTANWKVDSSTQLTISSVPAGYGDGPVEVTVFNFWGPSPANTKDLYWYGGDGVLSPGEKVVQKAVEYLGVPYLWAGSSPTTGVDCSGFCMYVYKQFGISLPHYSRSMSTYGTAVSKDDLQPGDLVFFYTPISHVGMYVGGGMMINAPRSGDLVCIEDAFRSSYVTARRMVSAYTRYEQGDSHLAYAGTWSTSTTTSASGGDFLYANGSGASVTIGFTGTYLGLIAKKSPVYGTAKVTLDDKTPVMVDLYSASAVYQQKVWNTGTLAAGSHTVKIEWTGTKNASATDTNIGLDGLDLIGNLTEATATPSASAAGIDDRALRADRLPHRVCGHVGHILHDRAFRRQLPAGQHGRSLGDHWVQRNLSRLDRHQGHYPGQGESQPRRRDCGAHRSRGFGRRVPAEGLEHGDALCGCPHGQDLVGCSERGRQTHQHRRDRRDRNVGHAPGDSDLATHPCPHYHPVPAEGRALRLRRRLDRLLVGLGLRRQLPLRRFRRLLGYRDVHRDLPRVDRQDEPLLRQGQGQLGRRRSADRGSLQRRYEVAAEDLGHGHSRGRSAHGQDRVDRHQERERYRRQYQHRRVRHRGDAHPGALRLGDSVGTGRHALRLRRHLDRQLLFVGLGRQLPLRRFLRFLRDGHLRRFLPVLDSQDEPRLRQGQCHA